MKLFSKNINWFLAAACVWGCAGGHASLSEYRELTELEEKRRGLELEYLEVLSNLDRYPSERSLRIRQGEIRKQLGELEVRLKNKRGEVNFAIEEWEKRIVQERVNEQIADEVERSSPLEDPE